jgi:hypothetical protein
MAAVPSRGRGAAPDPVLAAAAVGSGGFGLPPPRVPGLRVAGEPVKALRDEIRQPRATSGSGGLIVRRSHPFVCIMHHGNGNAAKHGGELLRSQRTPQIDLLQPLPGMPDRLLQPA